MDAMPRTTAPNNAGPEGSPSCCTNARSTRSCSRSSAREQVSRRAYEADIWLVEGGHVITFTAGKNTLTEVIVTNHEPLTDRNLLQSIPCRGEKYHEMTAGGNIRYMISTQEEQLTQTLYDATRHEIATYAAKRELMTAEGPATGDDRRRVLSVLDIERRSHELLVQSFHLFDENQMVIKTQAIIEVDQGRLSHERPKPPATPHGRANE